jgi:hypothetical protein
MIRLPLVASFALLAACSGLPGPAPEPASQPRNARGADAAAEDARLTALLDRHFDQRAALEPLQLTSLGVKARYGRLGDHTPEGDRTETALVARQLAEMRAASTR